MKGKKFISLFAMLGLVGTATGAAVLTACNKQQEPGPDQGVYYVSPTGTKTAAGTKNDPLEVGYVLGEMGLEPGNTVMLLPGTYNLSQRIIMNYSGTYDNYITIKSYDPNQNATLAFYDLEFLSTNRGVQIYSNYVHWDSVDVCGAGDNGLYIGGSYNIVENSRFYDNRDTGLQLGRSYAELYEEEDVDHINNLMANVNNWPSHNLIKNCTSFNNYDNETYGENADGFAAKLTVGYGNVFDGCIAYRNSDDGWDLYAKSDSGNIGMVIMYNCVAFENGYLLETQAEFNAKFKRFNKQYAEANTNSYKTNNGDGNGFKLGGSIMEGEVFMYNCISFNNGQHGVTDNSNPGVITIDGVISYNNYAGVDNDPTSETFGQIAYNGGLAEDASSNIDLARHAYSYNNIANVLSINDGNALLSKDNYRGSVENSILLGKDGDIYTVGANEECDTNIGDYGVKGTATAASDIFKQLPDKGMSLTIEDVHTAFRNEDNSINLGDLFAFKEGTSYTQGAILNKSSWEEYTHYAFTDLTTATSSDEAIALAVYDMLYLPLNLDAVYQDFDIVTSMVNQTITWTSSDPSLIYITDQVGTSFSHHSDLRVQVIRPLDSDKQVTLTASVTVGDVTKTRDFVLNVKKNTFRATGDNFNVPGIVNDEIIVDSKTFSIPDFTVVNATSDSGVIIDPSYYDRSTSYRYAASASDAFSAKVRFDKTLCGIWEVTETITFHDNVTLGKNAEKSVSYTYRVYISDRGAVVDKVEGSESIVVNLNGFSLTATPTNPTGYLYTYTVAKGAAAPSADDIVANGVKTEFRQTEISFNFEQDNSSAYDLYYMFANLEDEVTSQIYKITVDTVEISTKEQFEAMLASNDPNKIYMLTSDIDCDGSLNVSDTKFVGLLNGMGHTIRNVTLVNPASGTKSYGIFKIVEGGTIMNVNFENISITDKGAKNEKAGIIGMMYGGYVSNVKIHNITLDASLRAGALVGQIIAYSGGSATTFIDRIEVINDKDKDGNYLYAMTASERLGGVVGFIQGGDAAANNVVTISNCFVDVGLASGTYCGGIVSRSDDRNAKDYLSISNCIFAGVIRAPKYAGGIIGGFSGAGKTLITNCIYIGTMYYTNDLTLVTSSVKNCSGIMGYYASNGDITVRNCYSTIDEYNPNYGVKWFDEPVEEGEERLPYVYDKNFWLLYSGFDFSDDSAWEFAGEISGILLNPYVKLK